MRRLINKIEKVVTITYSHMRLGFRSIQMTVKRLVLTIVLRVVFLRFSFDRFEEASLTTVNL